MGPINSKLGEITLKFVVPIFLLIFSPYLTCFSWCFNLIVDEKKVKFTSFDLYCVCNVLCLTFRRNPQVLIERKTLEAISRKNRGPTKPQRIDGDKAKDRTAVHHVAQPCCSHGTTHGQAHSSACASAWAHNCTCASASRHGRSPAPGLHARHFSAI